MQALARLRLAQDPTNRCSNDQRHQLLLEVLEHLMRAEHHLRWAENSLTHQAGHEILANHVRSLSALRAKTEQLIQAAAADSAVD